MFVTYTMFATDRAGNENGLSPQEAGIRWRMNPVGMGMTIYIIIICLEA